MRRRGSPRLYLARTAAGNLWRFHTSLPDGLTDELHAPCAGEPARGGTPRAPRHREGYARLPTAHSPTRQVSSGPAYRGRGHAVDVVAGWARAVRESGAAPLYSTPWGDAAPRGVAAELGLRVIGADFRVT